MFSRATTLMMASLMPAAVLAFKEMELEVTNDPQEMAIIDEVGKLPCVFKLDDSFYDFTPLKVIDSSPTLPYFDGEPQPSSPSPTVTYNFTWGWC